MTKLYRSDNNKIFAGVLGGLGEHFKVDTGVLRLIYIVLSVIIGFPTAIVAYLLATLAMPKKRE